MNETIRLSVITPIYNEEDIIVKSTEENIAVLKTFGIDYEVILVNDGSSDSSKQLIENAFSTEKQIIIHNKATNEGMGSALRKGIELSTKDYIICVPADSPLSAFTFKEFIAHLHSADVLVSYRIKRLGYTRRMLLNSWVFHVLVTSLFGMNLRDYNWIHLYSRRIFTEGKVSIEYNGLFMLAEILIKCQRAGYSFCEFPVHQNERLTGIASASKPINVIKTLLALLHFRLKLFIQAFARAKVPDSVL